MSLSKEQVNELLKPIDPARVGKDGKGFAYVEAWDVRRTMNKIFGFAEWSENITDMNMIYENPSVGGAKPRWSVAYRARCEITVNGVIYAEWASGDATNQPSRSEAHDMAIKTAESQAFKRAAMNLGDQFGLGLYNAGSTDASLGDVVDREHADDGRVPDFIELLKGASTKIEIDGIAEQIRAADLGSASKRELITVYNTVLEKVHGS